MYMFVNNKTFNIEDIVRVTLSEDFVEEIMGTRIDMINHGFKLQPF